MELVRIEGIDNRGLAGGFRDRDSRLCYDRRKGSSLDPVPIRNPQGGSRIDIRGAC